MVEKVMDVFGRGVGMDVVQDVIKVFNGSISVKIEVGKGMIFIFKFLISMVIIQVFFIKVMDEIYVVLINNIFEIIEVKRSDLKFIGGREVIVLRGEIILIVLFYEFFGFFDLEFEEFLVIIVDFGVQKFVIKVDEFFYKKDIVIKFFGKVLFSVKGFVGVIIFGDGSVILIIDINSLLGGIGGGL